MRVKVNLAVCTKSGECYYNHPDLFRVGAAHFPEVLHEDVPKDLEWEARSAADVCPTQAILLLSDTGTPLPD